jgi:hypothetical protein
MQLSGFDVEEWSMRSRFGAAARDGWTMVPAGQAWRL